MSNPYQDIFNDDTAILRTFSQDVDEHELVWHRDREDRIVRVVGDTTDWLIQLDNELPTPLHEVFIPKGVYHRLIKGTNDLTVKIFKS